MTFIRIVFCLVALIYLDCKKAISQATAVAISGNTSIGVGSIARYDALFRNSSGQTVAPPTLLTDGYQWLGTGDYHLYESSSYVFRLAWNQPGTQTVRYWAESFDNFFETTLAVTVTGSIPGGPGVATGVSISGPTAVFSGEANNYQAVFRNNSGAVVAPPQLMTDGFDWIPTGSTSLVSYSAYAYSVRWMSTGQQRLRYSAESFDNFFSGELIVNVANGSPAALAATNITRESFVANWEEAYGGTSYRLDVSASPSFATTIQGYSNLPVTGVQQKVSGLTPGSKYYYRVRWVSSSGTSANSAIIATETLTTAPMITVIEAIASSSFLVKWNALNGAWSYSLQWSTRSDFRDPTTYQAVVGAQQEVTGLFPGTYYFVRVACRNGGGLSDYSEALRVRTVHTVNNYNYIKEELPVVAGKRSLEDVMAAQIGEKLVNWSYFDGLGRSAQKVLEQASPKRSDVVSIQVYDEFGRTPTTYLPYASGVGSGHFKTDPVTAQIAYYQTAPNTPIDSRPYGTKVFDGSPLNRVQKEAAPGLAWAPDESPTGLSDHSVKIQHNANREGDKVLLFRYDAETGGVNYVQDGALSYYAPGALYKVERYDEENHLAVEFKDKEGKVVLKRAKVSEEAGQIPYADTYYVYDADGGLVIVLPPEAVKGFIALVEGN